MLQRYSIPSLIPALYDVAIQLSAAPVPHPALIIRSAQGPSLSTYYRSYLFFTLAMRRLCLYRPWSCQR